VSILTEPRNALVRQYSQLFSYDQVELEFTDAALRAIAEQALARGTGARGLKGVLENLLQKTMFDLPSHKDIVRCVVDEDAVTGDGEIRLIREKSAEENTDQAMQADS
jgi:ATP-dependent Clp protease ATP-binding subunit ClpX